MLANYRFCAPLLALALSIFCNGAVVALAPDEAIASPNPPSARIVQGKFDSIADHASFQQALAKAVGGEIKIGNPGDDPVVNGDGELFDRFGYSVAIEGDTALVGVPYDDLGDSTDHGSVYVLVRNGSVWGLQAKLTSVGQKYGWFGNSVALSGNTALVGSYGEDLGTSNPNDAQGAAYVFTRSGTVWSQQAKLTGGALSANDAHFGWSVALSGDTAVVGMPGADYGGNVNQGVVIVFTRSGTTWSGQTLLTAGVSSSLTNDYFGTSVALDGNTALVGDRNESTYVFTGGGSLWSQQAKLTASDGASSDGFGYSVALAGDTALVGAYLDGIGAANDFQGSAYVFTRNGTLWSEQAKLTAGDGVAEDQFGKSVALSGETALVGTFWKAVGANAYQGSAYVFTRNGTTWNEQAKLIAGDGATNDLFGWSVALSGDTALVGADRVHIGSNASQGSAYVFTRNGTTWSEQAKLSSGDGATKDQFGWSVALSGDTALVGAHRDDVGANGLQGSAYVFTRNDMVWSLQAWLTAGDGVAGDAFGTSVALSGDTALIGARTDDVGAPDQGSAYVFTRSGLLWTEQAKLIAGDGLADDYFGTSVAVSGNTALVGAASKDAGANIDQGSVYVFTRNGTLWSQQAKLSAADGGADDQFGISVALSGDTALVGANGAGSSNRGSAYAFTRSGTTWNEQAKLTANDGLANDYFGTSVALSGDTALVGANGAGSSNQGSAYAFTRSGTTWNEQAKLTASDGAPDDYFGWSVALSGDTALVGEGCSSCSTNVRPDSAYVFTRSGSVWSPSVKLTSGVGFFGTSVAVSGETALVGAHGYNSTGVFGSADVGAVYLYNQIVRMYSDGFETVPTY